MTDVIKECCDTCHFARYSINGDGSFNLTQKVCKKGALQVIPIPQPGAPGGVVFMIMARPTINNAEYCGEWKLKDEARMSTAEQAPAQVVRPRLVCTSCEGRGSKLMPTTDGEGTTIGKCPDCNGTGEARL